MKTSSALLAVILAFATTMASADPEKRNTVIRKPQQRAVVVAREAQAAERETREKAAAEKPQKAQAAEASGNPDR